MRKDLAFSCDPIPFLVAFHVPSGGDFLLDVNFFGMAFNPRGSERGGSPLGNGVIQQLPKVTVGNELPRFERVDGHPLKNSVGSLHHHNVVHSSVNWKRRLRSPQHGGKLGPGAGSIGASDGSIGLAPFVGAIAANHDVMLLGGERYASVGVEYPKGGGTPA